MQSRPHTVQRDRCVLNGPSTHRQALSSIVRLLNRSRLRSRYFPRQQLAVVAFRLGVLLVKIRTPRARTDLRRTILGSVTTQ